MMDIVICCVAVLLFVGALALLAFGQYLHWWMNYE
jgi:hypothetical protein